LSSSASNNEGGATQAQIKRTMWSLERRPKRRPAVCVILATGTTDHRPSFRAETEAVKQNRKDPHQAAKIHYYKC